MRRVLIATGVTLMMVAAPADAAHACALDEDVALTRDTLNHY